MIKVSNKRCRLVDIKQFRIKIQDSNQLVMLEERCLEPQLLVLSKRPLVQ